MNAVHSASCRRRKLFSSRPVIFLVMLLATTGSRPALAQTMGRQSLHNHVPAVTARLRPVGSLAGTANLQLAISLPLRNTAALSNLLQQIYDPGSTNFHHYLTPEQFAAQFGPT